MWQKIILSCLLIELHADKLNNIYGTWTQVAFYPRSAYVPVCIEFVFERDPKNVKCNCTEGKPATLV